MRSALRSRASHSLQGHCSTACMAQNRSCSKSIFLQQEMSDLDIGSNQYTSANYLLWIEAYMGSAARLKMYELWFDFLKLARNVARSEARITGEVSREEIQKALEGSADFYASWDTNLPFNIWWKRLYRKFDVIVSIRGPDELDPLNPDLDDGIPCPSVHDLLLFIPVARPITELMDEILALINDQKKKAGGAAKPSWRFKLTGVHKLRPKAWSDRLTVYRDVALEHPTLSGEPLLRKVREFCRSQGESSGLAFKDADASALKKLGRYVREAEQTMLNVANGQFPGPQKKA